jgi:hypothetical protein
MNETELQLSRLFNAVIGEPPNHVTASVVRRRAARRRRVTYVTATAALAVAASVGVAVAASVTPPPPPGPSQPPAASAPRYYFAASTVTKQTGRHTFTVTLRDDIWSRKTGAITAQVSCPEPRPDVQAVAADADQGFFISCLTSVPGHPHTYNGVKIFRFTVTPSGQLAGFRPVPGADLAGVHTLNMAVTPDGSELAIEAGSLPGRPISEIIVIDAKTGKRAVWHSAQAPHGYGFTSTDLSFADHGQVLASFGQTDCTTLCVPGGQQLIAVSPASAGGRLASGRVVFRQPPPAAFASQAFIDPDGQTAIANVITRKVSTIYLVSTATGKPIQVLLRPNGAKYTLQGTDPSGRYPLVTLARQGKLGVNAWIDHGKLVPLKPAGATILFEAW